MQIFILYFSINQIATKIVSCFFIIFIIFLSEISQAEIIRVETENVDAEYHNVTFQTQAFIRAMQESEVSTQLSGQITKLSPFFEVGKEIKKGETLFWIENTNYRAAVAFAEQVLVDAELFFENEKARAEKAKNNWFKTHSTKPNKLVSRELYVQAAQAKYYAAQISLEKAKKDLYKTEIKSLFDGVVQQRDVSLGDYMYPGKIAGLLVQANTAVIDLPVAIDYLNHIKSYSELLIELTSLNASQEAGQGQIWKAKAVSFSPTVNQGDQRIRLRAEVSLLNENNQRIFINQYMLARITISGGQLLFDIPSFAFTQRNSIFVVNDGVIKELYPKVVYEYDGKKYSMLEGFQKLEVVTETPDLWWTGAIVDSLANIQ